MPGLLDMMGEFKVIGPVKVRPADLCVTEGHIQPGIVLVGDAFDLLPRSGNRHHQGIHRRGASLQCLHPAWLATDGMEAEKITAFYNDPVKTACDA